MYIVIPWFNHTFSLLFGNYVIVLRLAQITLDKVMTRAVQSSERLLEEFSNITPVPAFLALVTSVKCLRIHRVLLRGQL